MAYKSTIRTAVSDAFDDLEELANEMQDAVDQLRQLAKPDVPTGLAELQVTKSRRKSRNRLSNAYTSLADAISVLERLVPERCFLAEGGVGNKAPLSDDARQLITELDDAVNALEELPVD